MADSFPCETKNTKPLTFNCFSAPAKPADLQLSFAAAIPAKRNSLQLSFNVAAACQVCVFWAVRSSDPIFLPASALFLDIRSHSRTCRRYRQVFVAAAAFRFALLRQVRAASGCSCRRRANRTIFIYSSNCPLFFHFNTTIRSPLFFYNPISSLFSLTFILSPRL
ncbi:hypothetical protein MmiHf6_15160 [Methanimicrococcus hongohii]|uniref:Uncharacterized protein n=1 Tax=Methanimicrococcus hongohii TaxID=3028295 RepID=A0AA96ZUW1_9EURY|nr:hypothetical protein [Methanimicrococcus sp. Hf6]WNY24187.1 hypothetical protein MmiHf6_15160 [Methanimicrococcus sp. Hf6]